MPPMPVPLVRHPLRVVALALALLVVGCGGSASKGGAAATAVPPGGAAGTATGGPEQKPPFQPVPASADLVVGRNRFALGILDTAANAPLPDATVHFRFFILQGDQGTLKFEQDAVFRAPARESGLAPAQPHVHPDGSTHLHANAEQDVGVYTAEVTFDQAGKWGVEAQFVTRDGRKGSVRGGFDVNTTSAVPQVGQPAPRSRQPLLKDVRDIAQIDSYAEPDPTLHGITIADAIASGKPSVVMFATPGFCSSRFCGPSYEIVQKMKNDSRWAGRVNFIHVEVYKDFQKLTPSDTFEEWHLKTEPWFFIIDGQGIITARFDGPTTGAELAGALGAVVS